MKQCNKCKEWKKESEFHKHKLHKDGLATHCKICVNASIAEYQRTERGKKVGKRARAKYKRSKKGKATNKKYSQSPKGKENNRRGSRKYRNSKHGSAKIAEYKRSKRGRETSKRYRDNHPLKEKAKRAVNNAIRDERFPHVSTHVCNECHSKQAQHYHHWSYEPEHWFDVTPLCVQCHAGVHRETAQ